MEQGASPCHQVLWLHLGVFKKGLKNGTVAKNFSGEVACEDLLKLQLSFPKIGFGLSPLLEPTGNDGREKAQEPAENSKEHRRVKSRLDLYGAGGDNTNGGWGRPSRQDDSGHQPHLLGPVGQKTDWNHHIGSDGSVPSSRVSVDHCRGRNRSMDI